jgi:hypothetical protein
MNILDLVNYMAKIPLPDRVFSFLKTRLTEKRRMYRGEFQITGNKQGIGVYFSVGKEGMI